MTEPMRMAEHQQEKIETNLITLSRHVLHSQKVHPEASGDLTLLLVSIQVACKFISSQVRRAGLANLYASSPLNRPLIRASHALFCSTAKDTLKHPTTNLKASHALP